MLGRIHIGTLLGLLLSGMLFSSGCYSFKGISIPADAQTFYVTDLENRIPTAPSDLGQQFSEALKQKFINESRLNFSDLNPDIEFSGEISRFSVTSVAPQPGESIAFNRLEISVRMKYDYALDEENNWENTFTFFQDYSREQNLLDIQDGLITVIFTQLTEDIFNKAFTNW
ncbi:MAG: hypothetical protein HKN87_16905 [Saprospiraceae bacterium]|nr:hypothetical protein [Saprospiraceae bacterium]